MFNNFADNYKLVYGGENNIHAQTGYPLYDGMSSFLLNTSLKAC